MQTALMISVTNGDETHAALEGGADIIDIKNPAEGALGAPSPAMIQDACISLKGHNPFSIALGEFPGKPCAAALAAVGSAYFNPNFIKIAFIPNTSATEMAQTLQEIKKSLRCVQKPISVVAVAYADTLRYASWNLDQFSAIAKENGAEGCLVDTQEKKNKSLLDYLSWEEIKQFISSCHSRQLFCGLAGSLRFSDVMNITRLEPDIIGVRSAVCGGDRLRGTVSVQAVKELKAQIRHKDC